MSQWRAALAAAAVLLAGAVQAEPLRPDGKWALYKAPDNCELSRSFGSGRQKLTLSLASFTPTTALRVAFVGSGASFLGSKVAVQFDDTTPTETGFDIGHDDKGVPTMVLRALVPAPTTPAAHTLTLIKGTQDPVALETGGLAGPIAQLRACTELLVKEWGLDPDRLQRLARRPVPIDTGSWLHDEDYPHDRAYLGLSTTLFIRLIVDQTGAVTDCHALMLPGSTQFDQTTCKALKIRAHFDPALDDAGKPISAYFIYTIRFAYEQ